MAADPALQQLLATAQSVSEGAQQLHRTQQTLKSASGQLAAGQAQAADGAQQMAAGQAQLRQGAVSLHTGQQRLYDGIRQLNAGLPKLAAGGATLTQGAQQVEQGAGQLTDGIDKLFVGAGNLSNGATQLTDGAASLENGTNKLASGTDELAVKLIEAADKSAALKADDRTIQLIAEPVTITENEARKIDQYAIGIAPYFMSLSFLAGAVVFANAFPVRGSSVPGASGFRLFMSKLLSFGAMSIAQTLITCDIMVFALGLDVQNVPLFFAFSAIVSFTFMFIVQMLGTWLDKPGLYIGHYIFDPATGFQRGNVPLRADARLGADVASVASDELQRRRLPTSHLDRRIRRNVEPSGLPVPLPDRQRSADLGLLHDETQTSHTTDARRNGLTHRTLLARRCYTHYAPRRGQRPARRLVASGRVSFAKHIDKISSSFLMVHIGGEGSNRNRSTVSVADSRPEYPRYSRSLMASGPPKKYRSYCSCRPANELALSSQARRFSATT